MSNIVVITDIIECEDANGGCSQECNNEIGSFNCSCFEGYYLLADNSTCNGEYIVWRT